MIPIQIHATVNTITLLDESLNQVLAAARAPGVAGRQQTDSPLLNVLEGPDAFFVLVELPGVRPEQVELTVHGDRLTIACERARPAGVADDHYRRQERWYGRWKGELELPGRLRFEGVAAEMNNGIVTICLPKDESQYPRRIDVAPGGRKERG